jgi:hypothetical protein
MQTRKCQFESSRAVRSLAALARALAFIAIAAAAQNCLSQPATPPAPLSQEETQSLVKRVLRVEMQSAQDHSHPMQYRLRKVSPRLATTKLIVETKDGDVARLIAINDNPLSSEGEKAEQARLQSLVNDPSLQRHRQTREQGDSERARKVIRALPEAFLYTFAGFADTPHGPSYRLSFQPNPSFDPQDLEAQALKGMAGELWIDVAQQRVTRLEGKRIRDVDYGWGILGKLDQGGTLLLEQADIGDHQWRTTHMVLVMNARLLVKTVKLDTTLELSEFAPVTPGITYQQAIPILEARAKETPATHPSTANPSH